MPIEVKHGKLYMKDASGNLVQIVPEASSAVPDYQGATESASGVSGLVPAAQSADRSKFLRADGTWAQAGGSYKGSKETLALLNAVGSPSTGDIWKVEETKAFYVWDGTRWTVLSSAADIRFQYTPASSSTATSAYTAEAVEYDGTLRFGAKIAIDGTYVLGGESLTAARQNGVSEIQSFQTAISSELVNANSVIALEFNISQGSDDFWVAYILNGKFSDLVAAGSAGLPMTEDSSSAYADAYYLLDDHGKSLYVSCTDNGDGTYTFYPFIVGTEEVPESALLTLENADGTLKTADIVTVRNGLVTDVAFERPESCLVGFMMIDTDQFAVYYPNNAADYSTVIKYNYNWGMRFKDYQFGFGREPVVITSELASLPNAFQFIAAFVIDPSKTGDDRYVGCIAPNGESVRKEDAEAAIQANGKYEVTDEFRHSQRPYARLTVTITKPESSYVVTAVCEFEDIVQNVLTETLSYADGTEIERSVLLSDIAPASHSHDAEDIRLDGYQKPASSSAVSSGDSVGEAIGKLEKALDGVQAQIDPVTQAELQAGTDTSTKGVTAKIVHDYVAGEIASGSAASAGEFAANQTVQLTGDVTGSASSKAGWTVATTLANSGVTASTYGSTTQQTPAHGATFSIPYVTVDAKGRVTAAGTSTVQLPADSNTDTLVTQNVSTANENHPILLTAVKDAAANQGAKTSIFAAAVKVNPSSGTISATSIDVGSLHYLGERSFTIGTQGTGAGTYLQINSTVDSKSVTIANQGTNNITLTSKGNITAAGTITGNKIVGDGSGLTALDASKITTGTIDIARLPAGALERLVTVADETARFALTSSDVQLGDTVKQTDTGVMYYVVDTSKLNSAAGYVEYTAGTATSVPWSGITDKPTTIAGYGITDAKIVSGTITLGSATITPLTAASTLDASKLSGTASVSTTGNAATVTGTAGTSTLAWNSEVTLYTVGGHEVKAKLPANPNTDTKVKQYVGNTSQERPILSRYTITDASTTANFVVYDTGVTNNPANHTLTASGGFIGNATTSTQTKGVFLVIPDQTTQTATLTATVSGITEYFPGLTIAYRAPFNTAASSTLNINSLGAKPIYYKVNTTSKDYYPANTLVLLVYETTTASGGCWKMVYSYDGNNNNYDRRLHNNNVMMAAAVAANTIIVGTSAGYKQAASGITFDLAYPILVATEAKAAAAVSAKTYEALPTVNLQTTKASWTGTQYAMAFLVGTLSGNTVTIDSSVFTTTVPSTADGKIYIPIGLMASTYQIFFASSKDVYQYTNGSFHLLDTTTAVTGGTNGTIKINGTEIAVKGLESAAYTTSTAYAAASHNQASNTINAMTGYSKPSSTSAIGTSDTLNAAIGKLEKALDGKQASGTYLTPSSTLDATKLSGTIPSACYTDTTYSNFVKSGSTAAAGLVPSPGTTAGTTKFLCEDASWKVPYTHPTTSGNKHIPSGGSSGQFLGWSADGTAAWVGNPNWTTHLYAGAASNSTANATSATTNAATYIVVCDNSNARNAVQVTGTNGTTVSAVNGKLTIDSPALASVTNAQIDTLFA